MFDTEFIRRQLRALTDDELRAAVARDILARWRDRRDDLVRTWCDQAWLVCGEKGRMDLWYDGLNAAKAELAEDRRRNRDPLPFPERTAAEGAT